MFVRVILQGFKLSFRLKLILSDFCNTSVYKMLKKLHFVRNTQIKEPAWTVEWSAVPYGTQEIMLVITRGFQKASDDFKEG